jgi:hypothetical protein
VGRYRVGTALVLLIIICAIATPLSAARFYILEDFYNIVHGPYTGDTLPFVMDRDTSPLLYNAYQDHKPAIPGLFANGELQDGSYVQVNLEGQLELNMFYGKDFALGNSSTTGAGTARISDGFGYDFISRILLTGSVADRLFIEFDYDSERKEEELGGDRNTYSVSYRGKEDEFIKEVSVGNKELAIKDSRYLKIDEGNADSFALKADAGWEKLHMEGLLRFNDALSGRKEFSGSRNSIEFDALDVEYVRGQFFFIPVADNGEDAGIDEDTLELYKTATGSVDVKDVDEKDFALLTRGRDYTFDNTRGRIYLLNALSSSEELIVNYKKGGDRVGVRTFMNAIIDSSGNRDNFNSSAYSEYFDGSATYLYLRKNNFNSYWELKNGYFLDEYEGETLFNVNVELRTTVNKGLNSNYDDILDLYEIDTNVGAIFFNFEDSVGFYPRPFPGPEPYPTYNPFDTLNPIYGGVGDPLPENSVNTLHISYSYNTDIYFLDFNLVPGSVGVYLNGVLLDPKYYTVDYEFGMLAFDPGLIKSSDEIVATYRYTGFGSGEQGLFTALGFYYENGPFYGQNLTAYETGLKGREAPDVGSEDIAALTNATSVMINLGATDEDEEGLYAVFDGEFAFAQTNNNVYDSAIIADMEREDFTIDLSMNDQDWMLATKSKYALLPVTLTTRGDVLYKNYWEDRVIGSAELKTLSWNIPSDQVFSYSEKAGPYNTADKPTGGADTSLVVEYDFLSGSSEPYAAVVLPLHNANYSSYERFNMTLEGVDISGDSVQVYVELLQEYDEDLNNNSIINRNPDGENSINDAGFSITPENGNPTVIGTNREGGSNGRIDSEDLNGNGYLDYGSESGVLIQGDTTDYVKQLSTGNSDWQYISVDILSLIESAPGAFQNATALRITLTSVTSPLAQDAAGKLVINRIWFSGSSMVNESKEYLNISEVSVDEDPDVDDHALSKDYPGLYDELHGDASYRSRNNLVEKVLKVNFDPTAMTQLDQGEEATVARRFAIPMDISFYGDYSMFLYLPESETVPTNMDFTLSFVSGQNEELRTVIPGSQIVQGWNRIDVHLKSPYTVELNGQDVVTMEKSGDLRILNRLAEIQFGFFANSGDVTQPLEIWLDEWFVHNSEGYFDTAFITEGTFGYRGDVLSVAEFPLIGDPSLLLGYERQEGHFYKNSDERNDRVYTGLDVDLFKVLGTEVYLSRENTTTIRNEEELPGDLSTDDSRTQQSHALELRFDNPYIPSLRHSYDRIVTNRKDIELNPTDYQHNDDTLYDESLLFSERFDFPFGLSQAYTFNRFWQYTNSFETEPSQSLDSDQHRDASVEQQDRFDLSFSRSKGSIATYLVRDKLYTGLSVPKVDTWGSAYSNRLWTLFKQVGETIESETIEGEPIEKGTLSSTTDGYGLNINIPLMNVVGFSLILDTDYSQKNFSYDEEYRDTVYNHDFEMAFPFYFLGIDRIEVTPLMRREFRGDYKTVSDSLTRGEMFLESYKYLFMPPFYYMYPRGRAHDYDAVDIFIDEIDTSANTLSNSYILDVAFGYNSWFIPSWLTLGINGETRREGESYRQSRGWTTSIQYNVPLSHAEKYFKNNIVMTFDYEGERQFDTKVLNNSFSLTTEYDVLRTEFQGLKIYDQIEYTRQRQHKGEKSYYLKPRVPDTDTAIALVPPSDTIANEFRLSYLWEVFPKKGFFSVKPDTEFKSSIKNQEILTIENIYTITDREQSERFSNLLLGLTLEHETEYDITDSLIFTAFSKLQFGVEEKVAPDYSSGNLLTSLGFELGLKMEIYF